MKLSDLNVLLKIENDKVGVLYCGKYQNCVKAKSSPDAFGEVIMKIGDTMNTKGLYPENVE